MWLIYEEYGVQSRLVDIAKTQKDAHVEFVNDYEVEDSGLLFACIDKLERFARTSMEKGQYSNTIGAIKLLNEMLRLGADQTSCMP